MPGRPEELRSRTPRLRGRPPSSPGSAKADTLWGRLTEGARIPQGPSGLQQPQTLQTRSTPPRAPRTLESASRRRSPSNQREWGRGCRGQVLEVRRTRPALPPHLRAWMRLALSKHGPLPAAACSCGEAPEPPTDSTPPPAPGPGRRQAPGRAAASVRLQHRRTLVFWLRKRGATRALARIRCMPTPCLPSHIFFHPTPTPIPFTRLPYPRVSPRVQGVGMLTGHLNGALALSMALPSPAKRGGGGGVRVAPAAPEQRCARIS